jgi:hypothetical protein
MVYDLNIYRGQAIRLVIQSICAVDPDADTALTLALALQVFEGIAR